MTLFKKTSILALLAIFAKAPLAVAGEEKVHTDVEGGLPDGNHAVAHGGEYQSIPAAVADEPVAGGESASAALSEFGHAHEEEATKQLLETLKSKEMRRNLIRQETLQSLLNNGADVNARDNKDKYGRTALMWAAKYYNRSMAQLFLDKGADINIQDNTGKTALMWAALYNNLPIAQLLLEKDANVNARDEDGKTALIWIALSDSKKMIQCLLDKGADVNIQDNTGRTALIWAAKDSNLLVVRLLLDKGAHVNIQDNTGRTALDYVDETPIESEEIFDETQKNAGKIRKLLKNKQASSGGPRDTRSNHPRHIIWC